ncbi:dynein regulatory complex protein 9 [Condylostylus longicornis]|uniref:dynein regulatory complex protein 9 n=1 Tax=Condylostylus longicornis TaxID=2530218 RepID=UPI00244E3EA1|nr:dynein regulatory complex protein 9 [Condylostylus longicornis]
MDPLQIYLVTQIFNCAIDQLKITNKGRYSPCEMEVKDPCEIRFKSKIHESVYQQLDPLRPSEEAMNEQEVEEETNSLITFYIEIMEEIRDKGTFNRLLQVIQDSIDEADDEDKVIINHNKTHKHYNEVRYKWKHHDSNAAKEIYHREDILRQLRAELTVSYSFINLVKNWEATRFDQGTLYAKNVERDLLNELRYYDWKIRQEENAISNVEKLLDNINRIKSDHEEHLEIHKQQKEFIEEYTAQKRLEEDALREEEKRVESTIVIQSWWRGTMVRQHLGPYKQKKKKGKKGKKGK